MGEPMSYKYPTREQVRQDVANETTAINVAMTAMHEVLDAAPLTDGLKVYAAIELAIKFCGEEYAEEVFNEILLVRRINPKPEK